jgi:hypothetical protein
LKRFKKKSFEKKKNLLKLFLPLPFQPAGLLSSAGPPPPPSAQRPGGPLILPLPSFTDTPGPHVNPLPFLLLSLPTRPRTSGPSLTSSRVPCSASSAAAGRSPLSPASPCQLARHQGAIEARLHSSPSLTLIRFSSLIVRPIECLQDWAGRMAINGHCPLPRPSLPLLPFPYNS